MKSFFSDKTPSCHNINLLDDGNIISDHTKSTEIINNFFTGAFNNLDIDRDSHIDNVINSTSPVDNAIKMLMLINLID